MDLTWHPISDYESDPVVLEDRELRALSGVWIEQRSQIADSPARTRFLERLNREWAIETGLIERLYALDRGVTELLIERGIDAALIPHRSAEEPERIAAQIVDQHDAIESVFAFVRGDRALSVGYIKELHALFTRHQRFAEGRDHAPSDTGSTHSRGLQAMAEQPDPARRNRPRLLSSRACRCRDGPTYRTPRDSYRRATRSRSGMAAS